MKALLIDTHVLAWFMIGDRRLPASLVKMIEHADEIYVSAMSFYEMSQKVRMGKWPEMEPFIEKVQEALEKSGAHIIAVGAEISLLAGMMDWTHRDPFDRMLAATAIHLQLPLVSADSAFDELADYKGWIGRIW
ncbi:type II toxin-antitoxin system VapC family toxin [Phyllobacterium sp. SB3]|uniref:type II toxin-antitoxin system VapC family toxin n=1 Tax=Phyllobacterium sp. SB3 TaxID=3156073 RepID=UPI0032AF37F7